MTMVLWLGTYLLHSTVLCGVAALFRGGLRRTGSAEWIWRAAVFLPVITATVMQIAGGGLWTIGISGTSGPGSSEGIGRVVTVPSSDIGAQPLLLTAWLLISGTLIIRDWLVYRWFVRRLGTRHQAEAMFVAVLADVLRHTRRSRPVRLTYSITTASPVTLGRSEICLSERAMRDLGPGQLRALLAHEVAHITRGDGRWFVALAAIEAAFFFQPLNRVARRELRHLAETACDQWAAREVCDAVAMADCLVEVAAWSRIARPATIPGVIAGTSDLSDRITRLLDAPGPSRRMSRLPLLAVILVSSLALPCIAVSPATLPADFESRSAEFTAGFEAGRRFAAGQPDARLQSLLERGKRGAKLPDSNWRADVERQLQARAAKTAR